MLSRIDNIDKSYGGQVLFDKASLQIQPRERVGLVAEMMRQDDHLPDDPR